MPPASHARPAPSLRRSPRTLWRILGLALLHFLALKSADFLLFFLTHLPPVVFNIDPIINLAHIPFRILYFPRHQLRLLWPSETTPTAVNLLTALAASLLWGTVLHFLLSRRHRPQPPA